MASTNEALELRDLLLTLPQELYDQIYSCVFACGPGVRNITASYKPPVQMQICRALRQQFGQSYYGPGAIFHCRLGDGILPKWLDSLDKKNGTPLAHLKLSSHPAADPHPMLNNDVFQLGMKELVKCRIAVPTQSCTRAMLRVDLKNFTGEVVSDFTRIIAPIAP